MMNVKKLLQARYALILLFAAAALLVAAFLRLSAGLSENWLLVSLLTIAALLLMERAVHVLSSRLPVASEKITPDAVAPNPTASGINHDADTRFRDLFYSSPEMIAFLSPSGHFLASTSSFQSFFQIDEPTLLSLPSFDTIFPEEHRNEAASLFQRALHGESFQRIPLRLQAHGGRKLDFDLTLNSRRQDGRTIALVCYLLDVTLQRQRERRIALQLLLLQLLSEDGSPAEALPNVLSELSKALGWDASILWQLSPEHNTLNYLAGWTRLTNSDARAKNFLDASRTHLLAPGEALPGRVWQSGQSLWIEEIYENPFCIRRDFALAEGLHTALAIPIRSSGHTLAVLEFLSLDRQPEDKEAIITAETASAALGPYLSHLRAEPGQTELSPSLEKQWSDAMSEAVLTTNAAGTIDYSNQAAARLLGISVKGLLGRSLHEVLHGARASKDCGARCQMARAIAASEPLNGQDTVYRTATLTFPIDFSLSPLSTTPASAHGGVVFCCRDITQRFLLDRMKDEFISTVSHELRTPLTSIRGALGLLAAGLVGEMNPKALKLLNIAVSNSDRLIRLINDILDLERIQSGRAPLNFRRFALNDLIQQSIDGIQPVADAAGITLANEADAASLDVDPDRILQVITNLLSNAVKFSPSGSTVSVTLRSGSQGITISVIDRGRGIPADKLESIFDRFQQVDAADSRQKGGTGLGLAICRSIVQQHSGRIWAERNPDRGSTFRVFLPFRREAEFTLPLPEFDSHSVHGTILLADADSTQRRNLCQQLRRFGYRIHEATTMEQCLPLSREHSPDILLVDSKLPGCNQESLSALASLRGADPIPILLLYSQSEILLSDGPPALPPAASGWISKPCSQEDLLTALERVLRDTSRTTHILVVEDDPDLASVLESSLTRTGIEITQAQSCAEALKTCEEIKPELMVLDLSLPDGDGFHIVEALRLQEEFRNLPLIIYSAREIPLEERRHLALGPTCFLTKTEVQPQQLEALVLTMLRRTRQSDASTGLQSDTQG
jgi:PAS domain S-box-containing protein